MQFHLVAFAPLLVLLGSAFIVGTVSLGIRLVPCEPKPASQPILEEASAAQKRGAEILYFPAQKTQMVTPELGNALWPGKWRALPALQADRAK